VIVDIGLSGSFVATGLRVMVKQPDSRGIPGFFLAIFSAVTQFEVCPVGWYNCRMEFLGRTTRGAGEPALVSGHKGKRSYCLRPLAA